MAADSYQSILTFKIYWFEVKIFMANTIFLEWNRLSDNFRIIFTILGVIGASIISIYIVKLILVTKRLFQSFWASIEDED